MKPAAEKRLAEQEQANAILRSLKPALIVVPSDPVLNPHEKRVVCLACGTGCDVKSSKPASIISRFCPKCGRITNHNFHHRSAKQHEAFTHAAKFEPHIVPRTRE